MAEYIDREKAICAFWNTNPENDGGDGTTSILESAYYSSADIEAILSDIPAADVAPVIHARWKSKNVAKGGYPLERIVCTKCGFWEGEASDDYVEYYKFCPMCGAKIDNPKDWP